MGKLAKRNMVLSVRLDIIYMYIYICANFYMYNWSGKYDNSRHSKVMCAQTLLLSPSQLETQTNKNKYARVYYFSYFSI